MADQDIGKRRAAEAALEFLPQDEVIGVGTGSTVNFFIDCLGALRQRIKGAVASSVATAERLQAQGIDLVDLNDAGTLSVYIDGADEATAHRQLIKGGGGALTREKIIAAASRQFVCIADESKRVGRLGAFPLPVEVIPMARSYVAREIVALGGRPVYRHGFVTDNGNIILDVHGLDIVEPIKLEQTLNNIAGVVSNGLFAARGADVLLIGSATGVQRIA
ncbi:ribose-5-phosphate isomerase RpiA [Immundisolibacter cernigliae]|uniref:Ribose-5-phosphate isomerase A n=1 Tax=Immundisolibacter cernigliae TaxID=1810504 RepID=A0A1B1YR06_9GAMM|nr:ribose-5-phosphate isomerase RpiA [Immundisolibacter cernigliae]ANX03218.1 ribose-5-phosphate isomerase [Immundisolibacter cernigliae]